MRIAIAQFAPVRGEVDWNMRRLDSVLSKADPAALDDVDLIVCPELAFTGGNFSSLQDISPYLEPSTSGITALWARTTALRYNATVAVGYPEKVDAGNWPASPEYYNSMVVVNGNGETIANVRQKSVTGEKKWAMQSREDGFVSTAIEGLGQTTIGISSDLFASPPDCEFALHAAEAASNVILVSMSWAARSEPRMFSRTPSEPDMDALTSWTQQLAPLICSEEGREEVIVVFCNRCGSEFGVAYSGTSAVLGIKNGVVSVYGLLGRGVKELLVVDTDMVPFARLVQADGDQPSRSQDPPSSESGSKQSQLSPGLAPDKTWPPAAPASGTGAKCRAATPPRPARHRTREGSPSPATTRISRAKSNIPKIHIPTVRPRGDVNHVLDISGGEPSPNVKTPTCPSPIPDNLRPQFGVEAASEGAAGRGSKQPAALRAGVKSRDVHMPLNPTTPFLEFFRNTSPSSPASPFYFGASPSSFQQAPRSQDKQLYWVPPRQLLKSPTSTMAPLDTPLNRVMSMLSSCPRTLAAKTSQPSTPPAREAEEAPADPEPSLSKESNTKCPAAESTSRPRAESTSCKAAPKAAQGSVSRATSVSPKIRSRIQPAKIGSQSPDTKSPIASHSATASVDTAPPHSRSVVSSGHEHSSAPPSIDTKTLPTRLSIRRSHSNDSFSAGSPPFARPGSRRRQARAHPRSRSLSGSEQRGRQGGSHSLQHITFTPGGAVTYDSPDTHGRAPLVPSPGASHLRGRMPEIPRPSSIPRNRQPTSALASEIPRPSSIPRQRATSSRGDRSRAQTHRLDDPDSEIIATISRITADCPHHSVNRPMGPVVQSADGSLYTIELPQHVQDLALSLLNKPLTDTRTESRQKLVRKSLVW